MYGLRITLFAQGAGGIPTTTQIATDMSNIAASIEWSITDMGGYETCTITINGARPQEVLYYMGLLGSWLTVVGRDAPPGRSAWEGRLITVEGTLGQERRARSLEGMGNRVKVRYTTVNGVPGVSSTVSGAASQSKYGIRDLTETLPTVTSTAAGNRATTLLAARQWPKNTASSTVGTGDLGESSLVLTFHGPYYEMSFVQTSDTSTTNTTTTTQITNLLADFNAVNNYISTTTALTASGITDTEYIAPDTPYREKIESLLSQGNGTNRYAWGVLDEREFYASVWAGATPATITYQRYLSDGRIFTPQGAEVYFWNVRPNAMCELADLKDVGPASTEVDAAARFYVSRISFRADESGIAVTLEPSDSDDLGARLARLESGKWM